MVALEAKREKKILSRIQNEEIKKISKIRFFTG
jgi:hypothetical protein